MNHETCPHCGMTWNETMGEYECGSYPAGSSVVRATACTEIARLQAQLSQAERVVVPEQSAWATGGRVTLENSHVAWLRYLHAGMESWLELCDSNHEGAFRVYRAPVPAPASRVLKDGEVAVDAEEWEAMCSLGFDPEPCRLDHHGYCQEHNWFSEKPCPTATLQKLSVRQLHEDRQNEGVRMTTQRKPSPEVDHGGRVYYVEKGKVYEGRRSEYSCDPCHFVCALSCDKRRRACYGRLNGERGHRTLHPVQAVG